jgi:hypothetical protein
VLVLANIADAPPFPTSSSTMSYWELETSHGGSINTMIIRKWYISGLFLFFPRKLLNIYQDTTHI